MTNFYGQWLKFWEESQGEKKQARTVIHEEELEWVETPQDFRVALMAAPENGFRTWGSEALIAAIPPGCHTGKHAHGEEGIYIVEGEGFSLVNGVRYDWAKDSVLWIPFGAEHQHFNTGDERARYFSVMCLHLEHWLGLGKLDQIEGKGFSDVLLEAPVSMDGFDSQGRRIFLRVEEAPALEYDPEEVARRRATGQPQVVDVDDPESQMFQRAHRDHFRLYMDREGRNGFKNQELELSWTMGDAPGRHGGKHAHMEAMLYIVEGEGYTVVDGAQVPWKKGSLLHVQGPQTEHQHFNTGTVPSVMLRFAPGIRFNFFQRIARERFPYLWFEPGGANEE